MPPVKFTEQWLATLQPGENECNFNTPIDLSHDGLMTLQIAAVNGGDDEALSVAAALLRMDDGMRRRLVAMLGGKTE